MSDELLPFSEDGYALVLTEPMPCFICKQPTTRLDICFEAPFCNSKACNQQIANDVNK